MQTVIQTLPASRSRLLRPLQWIAHWLGNFFKRLKLHFEPVWFILSYVLPALIVTRRRPVLVSRFMALGDIICTFPAIHQLKKRHPGATFIYHCREDYACLPRLGGITTHTMATLNVRRMETTYAFLFSGIYKFTYSDEFENTASTESVIEEYCRQHGVEIRNAHAPIQLEPTVLKKVEQVLTTAGLDRRRPMIAIHPGPSGPFREWNHESWVDLVAALKRSGFNNIIQLGASRPDDMGKALSGKIPDVISFANQLSLEESAALISLCNLLIGIDSGLLHIAASVGTPFVGIFGATSPQLRFSPAAAQGCVVSRVACQGCHHRIPRLHWVTGCPYNFECMKSIQANDVLQACLSKLSPALPGHFVK